jgi:CubicO group peptidase (beta-lactamase class C family)
LNPAERKLKEDYRKSGYEGSVIKITPELNRESTQMYANIKCLSVKKNLIRVFEQNIIIGLICLLVACNLSEENTYPHADDPIGSVRDLYDATLPHELAVNTYRNTDRLFAARRISSPDEPVPLQYSQDVMDDVRFTFEGTTYELPDYLELNYVAGLLILDDGKIVHETYRFGNTEQTRWMSMSIAKSVTSTLVAAAVRDGYIERIDDQVTRYVPSLEGTAYDGVSIRDVLTMTSGVEWNETYTDPESDRRQLLEAQILQERSAVLEVMKNLERENEPGTVYRYNTGETQIVAEVLYRSTGMPLSDYLSERIWKPMGAEADAYWWLDAPDGVEIGGSGIAATLRDYGRFGQFVLDNGIVNGEQILPEEWIEEATTPKVLPDETELDYGYLWWTGTSTAARRDGAFSAEGIFGQMMYINPAARVVIVVWSAWPEPLGSGKFDWDWSFFEAVADSLRN